MEEQVVVGGNRAVTSYLAREWPCLCLLGNIAVGNNIYRTVITPIVLARLVYQHPLNTGKHYLAVLSTNDRVHVCCCQPNAATIKQWTVTNRGLPLVCDKVSCYRWQTVLKMAAVVTEREMLRLLLNNNGVVSFGWDSRPLKSLRISLGRRLTKLFGFIVSHLADWWKTVL